MATAFGNFQVGGMGANLGTHFRIGGMAQGNQLLYEEELWQQVSGTDINLINSIRDTGRLLSITGKSWQTVTATGKNLFDKTTSNQLNGNYYSDTGVLTGNPTYGITQNYHPVNPNMPYTASGIIGTNNRLIFFDASKVFISRTAQNILTATTPANCRYIDIQYTVASWDINTVQLEQSATATVYEPFVPGSPSPDYQSPISNLGDGGYIRVYSNGSYQDILIPSPVYEGDVIGNDLFTHNRTIFTLNGTENWGGSNGVYTLTIANAKSGSTMMSDYFKSDVAYFIGNVLTVNYSGTLLEFKTWLGANNAHFLYELLEPTTEAFILPSIEIGINDHIYAEGNPNLTVEYRAA
jgi:hypothetical protein